MLPVVVLSICMQQGVYCPRALLALKQRQFKLDLEAYITGLKKAFARAVSLKTSFKAGLEEL